MNVWSDRLVTYTQLNTFNTCVNYGEDIMKVYASHTTPVPVIGKVIAFRAKHCNKCLECQNFMIQLVNVQPFMWKHSQCCISVLQHLNMQKQCHGDGVLRPCDV